MAFIADILPAETTSSSGHAGAQALRDQRYNASRDIDGRFDVALMREVACHINSTHVGLESFRIINRYFG